MSADLPEFARGFQTVVAHAYDELAAARETADPDEQVVVMQRADNPSSGLHAILFLGSKSAIDEVAASLEIDE